MIHCEIIVELVFHEILWKKHFTVYPSLNRDLLLEIALCLKDWHITGNVEHFQDVNLEISSVEN